MTSETTESGSDVEDGGGGVGMLMVVGVQDGITPGRLLFSKVHHLQ